MNNSMDYALFDSRKPAPRWFSIVPVGLGMWLCLFSSLSLARTPQAEDIYLPGSKVEYPAAGLSFSMPGSAMGMASQEHPEMEMFITVQPSEPVSNSNGSLHLLVGAADFKTVVAELDREAVVENGLKIFPQNKVIVLDDRIAYNDFSIESEDELKAFVMAVIDPKGIGLMLVAIAAPELMPAYKKAMLELARSMKTTQVAQQAQPSRPAPAASSKPANPANHDHALVGAWMRRSNYRSSGIYIENSNKWVFSADGRVAWGSGTVVAGGTDAVSIRGGGDNPPDYGRWSTQGDKLKIQWDDGSTGEWTFSNFEYDGIPYLALTTRDGTVYRYRKVD